MTFASGILGNRLMRTRISSGGGAAEGVPRLQSVRPKSIPTRFAPFASIQLGITGTPGPGLCAQQTSHSASSDDARLGGKILG